MSARPCKKERVYALSEQKQEEVMVYDGIRKAVH